MAAISTSLYNHMFRNIIIGDMALRKSCYFYNLQATKFIGENFVVKRYKVKVMI